MQRNDKLEYLGREMSGSTSMAVSGGGADGYKAPFTAVQWQELEHQALIYKYLVAGVPVPSDLVLPIRRSLAALSARFLHHPALGYGSYYGKKFDPEPGRCRRTDGKKWRCSKDAYQESKYCERHMNRGRNRSRKPVESPQSTSQSLSTDITVNSSGSYQNVSSSRSSSQSLYSITNSGSYDFGSDGSTLQMDSMPYAVKNKDVRYAAPQGLSVNVDDENGVHSMESSDSWRLMPSQVVTNSLNMNMIDDANSNPISSKQMQQQHSFFGNTQIHQHPWSHSPTNDV